MSRIDETTHVVSGKRGKETDKAVLFSCVAIDGEEIEDGPKSTWFPFSMITQSFTDTKGTGQQDWVRVKRWILQQKEMI